MGRSNKKKDFIKKRRVNPVVLDHKMNKLSERLEEHKKLIDAVTVMYEQQIEHLANFARHDMKNAVQSMDSVLNTIQFEDLSSENYNSLKVCLENLRTSVDNLSSLAPTNSETSFNLPDLINAVQSLARAELDKNKIQYEFDYPRKGTLEIHQSFQRLLQVLHNLIINSIKALNGKSEKRFKLTANVEKSTCEIQVYDNGEPIADTDSNSIFKYGYSTTGGSGIGLYHAKNRCEQMSGTISLENSEDPLYTKKFTVKFPIQTLNPE